jgi:hypothetical protein
MASIVSLFQCFWVRPGAYMSGASERCFIRLALSQPYLQTLE